MSREAVCQHGGAEGPERIPLEPNQTRVCFAIQ
jgi:hypothetical protein